MTVISVNQLSKSFKTVEPRVGRFQNIKSLVSPKYIEKNAVAGITFQIDEGEIVGYLGPNGAGKSTSIKMLTGILTPTSGEVKVAGFIPHKHRKSYVKHIGAVFGQKTQLWWDLPVIDSFRLLKEIYQIPHEQYESNIKTFDQLLSISEFQNKPVRQLSLGQRMRADLAASLLHNPRVLFLDEPTIGLDVVAKAKFRDFIKRTNLEFNTTVILTTHDMTDVEKLCSRIILINQGSIELDSSIHELQKNYTSRRELTVDFGEFTKDPEVEGGTLIQGDGWRARFNFDAYATSPSALIIDLAHKYVVKDIKIEEPKIEAIVSQIYQASVERVGGRQS